LVIRLFVTLLSNLHDIAYRIHRPARHRELRRGGRVSQINAEQENNGGRWSTDFAD